MLPAGSGRGGRYVACSFSRKLIPERRAGVWGGAQGLTCLVPLTTSDAVYARTYGWRALERANGEEQADLVDLNRASLRAGIGT